MTTATITDAKTIDTTATAAVLSTIASAARLPLIDMQEIPERGIDVSLPLNTLFLSRKNVRTKRNKQSIPELAALIESQGLLQRLLVTDAGDGRFAVEAGGRRLESCELLVEKGVFAADELIDCRLFPSRRAVAISTARKLGS